ncbi:MAG: orotidine-5'-phosphate decarboxylase [Patescibacteria group bacterium]|jgi:uridine monophosphate synthetase
MTGYYEWVEGSKSLLCVGLDPTPQQLRLDFLKDVVLATAPSAAVFKPNFGFYLAGGLHGLEILSELIKFIHGQGVPVILDGKWNDIGNTAVAYGAGAFDAFGADAVTVNPYLGLDSVEPFLRAGKGVYILCHTTNPGSLDLQHQMVGGQPLYLYVAELTRRWGSDIGLVVGATFPEAIQEVREIAPNARFLIPGVGSQGGDLERSVAAGLIRATGAGVLVNASRSIVGAPDPGLAAEKMFNDLNAARDKALAQPVVQREPYERLIRALFDAGCVKFGSFTLASGKKSPIYIDLRMLVSDTNLLWQVARAYDSILSGLVYDRLAAIPYAALPIGTAISLINGRPMIYPREAKDHGTGQSIEGARRRGEVVVVIDDLITTAKSKFAAIDPLQEDGLQVQDIVVLIDREQGGREQLELAGYHLHSLLTLRQIVGTLARLDLISAEQQQEVEAYLAA